ncbi:efflux RND transporter permease subunit [Clostridium sp. HBUAS56010]|uniref:efflux RND transporter permease subunit n=1 Tax=Clostridium sp. HBUAS56010 TaxID=2571127 RepID=UPI001177D906|nr:efflux RND transporter permease subunit [Clostridium sp. HBUAS56010]
MGITKLALKRPITIILGVLCLIVFGLSSVLSSKLELIPEMNYPILIVSSIYQGASPNDVNDLVSKPIEDEVGTLSGIKHVQSTSRENVSIVMLQYEYGTNMDKAYSDLKKKIDNIKLPDDVKTPGIMEVDINARPVMTLAVNDPTQENLYNYVKNDIIPDFEKISSVASIATSGGQEGYVRVRISPEKLNQYHLTMDSITQSIQSADFIYPSGSTGVGNRKLAVSTSVEVNNVDQLKKVPIVAGKGKTIYLEDIADIESTVKKQEAIGRYNGKDTITLSVNKQQKNSAIEVSKEVNKTIQTLKQDHKNLDVVVIEDTSNNIKDSLYSVMETMILAVVISMVIIFLFFGDIKASLIVGSSIPVSILVALILMSVMGFSMNMITMSAIVLGVGMMVDDSIVVLESCFRSQSGTDFEGSAIQGTKTVLQSILGGTITKCVVFIPLVFLAGMTGQIFKPLGYTIIFCMMASLISSMTIVPLCYTRYRPLEKHNSPLGKVVTALQHGYRTLIGKLLDRKAMVILVSVLLLVVSFVLAGKLGLELMPETDQGTITVTTKVKPGLKIEEVDKILQKVEAIAAGEKDLESYTLTYGGDAVSLESTTDATLTAYLKPDRSLSTRQVVNKWKKEMGQLPDGNISVRSSSGMSMSQSSNDFEVILKGPQLEGLKHTADQLVSELTSRPELIKVHSDLENAAPVIKVKVDPIKAAAEGIAPVSVGGMLNRMLSGVEATKFDQDGQEITVKVEYPDDSYDTLDKVEGIMIPSTTGGSVSITDIASIGYEDSPSTITRKNKQFQVTVTGSFTDKVKTEKEKQAAIKDMNDHVVSKYLNDTITRGLNSEAESMNEELGGLFLAIATAIFLVFVVLAAQFESPVFSLMVMVTIPFSFIGAFGLMLITNVSISMTSMLGFLVLIGTVLNSGILYVDCANQFHETMDVRSAVIEAGFTRLRPILMTALIAILSLIPLARGAGENGEIMQGLALVNIGGLASSTLLSLLVLPVLYSIMSRKKEKKATVNEESSVETVQ